MYPQREGGSFGSYIGQWNNHPPNYTELYTSNMLLRPGYLMVSHCSNINVEGVLRSRSGSWAGYIYLPGRATKTPDVYPACCKSACHNWIWQGDHDTSKEILIRVSFIDKSKGEKKKKHSLELTHRHFSCGTVVRHISVHTITMPRKRQRPDNDEVIQDSSEGLRLTRSRACMFSCFPGSTFQCSKLTDNRHRV